MANSIDSMVSLATVAVVGLLAFKFKDQIGGLLDWVTDQGAKVNGGTDYKPDTTVVLNKDGTTTYWGTPPGTTPQDICAWQKATYGDYKTQECRDLMNPQASAPAKTEEIKAVLTPSVDTRLGAEATIRAINDLGLKNTATGGWLSSSQVDALVAPINKAKADLAADKANRTLCANNITAKAKAEFAAGIRPTPYWNDQDYLNYAGCRG